VEIEAIELGLAGAARGGMAEIRLVAEAADAGACAGAESDAALGGMPLASVPCSSRWTLR
jgi:hypothetical protein